MHFDFEKKKEKFFSIAVVVTVTAAIAAGIWHIHFSADNIILSVELK